MNDMSNSPIVWRAWLPESALARGGADQALADAMRQWSTKWLARKGVRPLGTLTAAHMLPVGGSLHWLTLDDDVAIALTGEAMDRLAMLMLGETVPPTTIVAADRRVIDNVIETALQDLCRRIAELLGLSPDARWRELGEGEVPTIDRPRTCQLGVDPSTPLINLAIATDALFALAKARSARGLPRQRVKPIVSGLAAQGVDISASLGRCSLTLADLAGLGVGDVLLFDGAADAPLVLALNGKPAGRGKCTVQHGADSLELRLLEPLAF